MESDRQRSERVSREVERVLGGAERVVLAVSGGRDSMVLLHAAAATSIRRIAAVATFDHGTGASAKAAATLVTGTARALGIPIRHGRARGVPRTEVAWRDARWAFLRSVGRELDSAIATAHTRDDQVETVIMRVLRGTGARGLAALYAPAPVLRPLLECLRDDIDAYARSHGVRWREDPSNATRQHLRNRVRLDLRPALERVRPGISEEFLALARRAVAQRAEVEAHVSTELAPRADAHATQVAREPLLRYDAMGLALLWTAIAGRSGIALDRRGVERLVALTRSGRAGARIQLSGGFEAVVHRDQILLRRAPAAATVGSARLTEGVGSFGHWSFRPAPDAGESLWSAALPMDAELTVRGWQPGDRMTPVGAETPRRVKGLLRDAGIDAARRAGWPVVLAGTEIVWIPGVRRSPAATARSGRPVVCIHSDLLDDR